jgi:SAM-dependent methyltransferase
MENGGVIGHSDSLNATELFLRRAHAMLPAVTPKWFDHPLEGRSGGLPQSSYDRLAACVREVPAHVLDLACGDGILCERLLRRFPAGLTLTAVDLSEAELEAARRRLEGNAVDFRLEPARALTLPDRSVDVALCHMALMLLSPLEPALREVGRVLKPGGTFAAVVGRGWRPGPIQELFRETFRQALGEYGGTPIATLGDERTRTRDGLVAAFAASGAFHGTLEFEELDLVLDLAPGELADFMMGVYDTLALSERGRAWMRARLESGFAALAGPTGRFRHTMGLRLVHATAL